jgi:hypothetical protein
VRWPQSSLGRLAFAIFEPEAGRPLRARGRRGGRGAFDRGRRAVRARRVRAGRVDGRRLVDVVAADGARHAARTFVFAAGPWLPRLFPALLGPLVVVTARTSCSSGHHGRRPLRRRVSPAGSITDRRRLRLPSVDGRWVKVGPEPLRPRRSTLARRRRSDEATIACAPNRRSPFPDLGRRPVVETRSASTRRRRTASSSSTAIRTSTTCGSSGRARATASSTAGHRPLRRRADQGRGVGPARSASVDRSAIARSDGGRRPGSFATGRART